MNNKILLIDNYDSFTHNLRQIVEEFTKDYFLIKNDDYSFNKIEQCAKILISPGPGIPGEAPLVNEIIKKYSSVKSILGICLGHQAIAEVFGGGLFNCQTVYHGISGEINITDPSEYLFENIPQNFEAGLYHSWAVRTDNFPSCMKITSLSKENVVMSISHYVYDVKGIQFHPESIMTKYGRNIIQNWIQHK